MLCLNDKFSTTLPSIKAFYYIIEAFDSFQSNRNLSFEVIEN